ncbi:uncharacterized protein LOC116246182 [Nymphaea colorata]|nr:uncharacterized protein LOC116246182 [Nymphaea colorata]
MASSPPEAFSHSPVHYAVALSDHSRLSSILSRLPRLRLPSVLLSEAESIAEDARAEAISAVVDRRDGVPGRLTPLHLAVARGDVVSVRLLVAAGADPSLQDARGWNALQESVCRRRDEMTGILVRHHQASAWAKWRRRLPLLVAALRRMRDFYMELSFHFESSLVPFLNRVAPSDTYRVWKRDADLRADTTISGFDGLKTHRSDQSFLFLGDGTGAGPGGNSVPPGSLLLLDHENRDIVDALENASTPPSVAEEAAFRSQSAVFRPGMDVTRAELVSRLNWRRQERTEMVGPWKARLFDVHNVSFSFKTRKVEEDDFHVSPLEFIEDTDDDGFLVAENPDVGRRRNSSYEQGERIPVDKGFAKGRRSVDVSFLSKPLPAKTGRKVAEECIKESEYKKSLRPCIWLTDQFPLKTEELLPLLDILANKVKAVRRLRELLTTKLPPGTFPVKVSIPVVPTVRVVITFTKFEDLPPVDQFFTPLSSPSLFHTSKDEDEHVQDSSWNSWLRRPSNGVVSRSVNRKTMPIKPCEQDPFAIPANYVWATIADIKRRRTKEKKPKLKKAK